MNNGLVGNEEGLKAYYKFNEGTGTTLKDYSSYNNNGTITATWVKLDNFRVNTLYFELNTDSYTNGMPVSFDSVEFVCNPTVLEIYKDGYKQRTNNNAPSNTKYKMAIIWNGTNYEFYINGQKYISTVNSGSPNKIDISKIFLGYGMYANYYYYDGKIYDVRLSSKTLTEQQAIDITSTTSVDTLLNKDNTEVIYKFIEYREIDNTTSTPTLKEEINYTYDTNWVDQLTQYKDYEITYDEIGNPLTIVKDDVTYYSFTWEKGRQLKSMYVYRGDLELNDIYYYLLNI